MNLVNKTIIALATGVVLTTSIAHATGGQPYIGAKIGQFNVDNNADTDIDDATAYGVYAGYSFNNNFGAEVEYLTSKDTDFTEEDGEKGEYSLNTTGLYATYHHHFPNQYRNLYAKGKLGVAKTKVELNDSHSFDETGIAGGVALGYNLSSTAAIELEYTKLPSIDETDDNAETDSDLWTIGAHYRF